MTSGSGTEVGQVFVRVTASGDAIAVLKQVQQEMRKITSSATSTATKAAADPKPAAKKQADALKAMEQEVAAQNKTIKELQASYIAAVASLQKLEQAQTQSAQATAASNTAAQRLSVLQAQNAASVGDFASALAIAVTNLEATEQGTVEYEAALKVLIQIQQQVATQSRTLAKAAADNGANMMKLAQQTRGGSAAIEAAYEQMAEAAQMYSRSLRQVDSETNQFDVSSRQFAVIQGTLSKAFEQVAIKAINEERAIRGLDAAIKLNRETISTYGAELRDIGSDANALEANLAKLIDAEHKLAEARARRARQDEIVSARETVQNARHVARYQNITSAMGMLQDASSRYEAQSRARAIIENEIIRLQGTYSDVMTRRALSDARALERTRDYAEALRVLEVRQAQLVRGGINSRGSIAVAEQLDSAVNRVRIQQQNAARDWWHGPIGQLRNLSGTVLAITGAFYTLRDAAVSTFQAMQAGALLSTTEAQMKLLAASTAEYEMVLQAASQNIELFGGTLQSTLADMNRLAILSKQTGASVDMLNKAVLLLSTKDPQQGAEGAVIALNEALAEGQVISLRRRFELVGSSISYFGDESISANEKLARLIETLSDMGISMELLEGSVGSGARAVNEFGAATEETWARIGQALSVAMTDQLKALTAALRQANEELQKYAENQQRINEVPRPSLTNDEMRQLYGSSGLEGMGGLYANPMVLADIIRTTDANKALAETVGAVSDQYMDATVKADAYAAKIDEIRAKTEEQNAATLEIIINTLRAAEAEAFEASVKKELVDLAERVAKETLSSADAAAILEQKYGSLGLNVQQLEAMFRALAAQSNDTSVALIDSANKAASAWETQLRSIMEARSLIGLTGSEAARARLEQLRRRYDELAPLGANVIDKSQLYNEILQAELDLKNEISQETANAERLQVDFVSAIGDTAKAIPLLERLRKEYAQIASVSGSATEEEKQRALVLAGMIGQLEQLVAPDKGGGSGGSGGGGGGGLSDQQKLNNQLAIDQLRADQKAQDALIAHEERMLEIREDYAERTLRAIEAYQEDQKSGRASFYESLTGIEDHGLQKAMSAQFEAAAMEAGKIAQTLGPDVAAKFLQQMQKNIMDQAKRQEDINKALDKNSEDFNPALAEYLRGVDQLFRVSEQGAINQILRARDSLASSEQQAIRDAEQKYIDALANISDTAAESAERRIEAARLAGKEIDLEIAKVRELGAMYEKIGFMPGSQQSFSIEGDPLASMAGISESLGGMISDITGVLNAIRANTGDTVGAVRRLSPSVTQ